MDSTLSRDMYRKIGQTWYTTDRISDSVKTKRVAGDGWTGIYGESVCGISCKSDGFHAVQGECDNLYYSNGKITIALETNGHAFDEHVVKRLMQTIHFN